MLDLKSRKDELEAVIKDTKSLIRKCESSPQYLHFLDYLKGKLEAYESMLANMMKNG